MNNQESMLKEIATLRGDISTLYGYVMNPYIEFSCNDAQVKALGREIQKLKAINEKLKRELGHLKNEQVPDNFSKDSEND